MNDIPVVDAPDNARAADRKTALIVDDEFLIRWSLRSRLQLEGFTVTEANDVASARAAFAPPVAVVLLDLRLPDGDGLDLLEEFLLRWPPTRVIVMTAHGTQATEASVLASGAHALVHKPFDLEHVVRLTHMPIPS